MTNRGPHVLTGDEPYAGRNLPPFAQPATVVDASPPTKAEADRDILPMSTGVPILPMQSAQMTWNIPITGRSQVYKIRYFVISNAGTAGGWTDWIVKDIKINGVSQFVQPGDLSGAVFAHNATNETDKFVRFAPVQTGMDGVDVVVVVMYIGHNMLGCPFFGSLVGTLVDTKAAEI